MKSMTLLVLALSACGPVDLPTSSTSGGGSSGGVEATTSSTDSSGPGASGQADGESSGSTTDAPAVCAGWALGEFDFIFQACCDEPFATCSDWCADNSFGECAYVLLSEDACANELPYPYCDLDPWAEMPTEDLSVRCVCMP